MGEIVGFGQFLVARGLISDGAWARVQEVLAEAKQGLAGTITGLGLLSEKDLMLAFEKFFGYEQVDPNDWPIEPLHIDDLNPQYVSACAVLPVRDLGDEVLAIIADPTDKFALDALKFATGKPVIPKLATLRELETAINHLYFGIVAENVMDSLDINALADDVDRLKELATDAPVIRFVDRMIDDALLKRASDIHVEPSGGLLAIRLRVDGVLIELPGPSRDMGAAIVSRLKIMSGLDIAERRLPQDGRMRVRAHGKEIDFRVATSCTSQGEAVVLRLLDRGAVKLEFDSLGFDDQIKEPFRAALRRPDGIVLVTGPTGSGKTTTLYTGLAELNTSERKILTVEDPVEYVIDGLGQVQVDARIGRTFANSLRSFLRQDPDVIMVGEIRDDETAGIAIQASLTGHVVLSTLHTNSAAAAISRLMDMGVEDYLLASTLRVVMAQRLIRTLCNECKTQEHPSAALKVDLKLPENTDNYHTANGCHACNQSGYNGRTMIGEILEITPTIEQAILAHKSGTELETIASTPPSGDRKHPNSRCRREARAYRRRNSQ
ncbi:MAG: Flp pilus assembly complex ATPase component TadA [Kordiimonadaceae bacterium]|nr:Flp pilus assembly complex ATPase component TadA [Kordiimonadaceae bacterium]